MTISPEEVFSNFLSSGGGGGGNFLWFLTCLFQHCIICHPSDFTVSEAAEPWVVEMAALTVRRSSRSHTQVPHFNENSSWVNVLTGLGCGLISSLTCMDRWGCVKVSSLTWSTNVSFLLPWPKVQPGHHHTVSGPPHPEVLNIVIFPYLKIVFWWLK